MLARVPFGINLPAPNLSKMPIKIPTPAAFLLLTSTPLSSISSAVSPEPITPDETNVAPPMVSGIQAGAENATAIAAAPVPTIAVPELTEFSTIDSATYPTAAPNPSSLNVSRRLPFT